MLRASGAVLLLGLVAVVAGLVVGLSPLATPAGEPCGSAFRPTGPVAMGSGYDQCTALRRARQPAAVVLIVAGALGAVCGGLVRASEASKAASEGGASTSAG